MLSISLFIIGKRGHELRTPFVNFYFTFITTYDKENIIIL